MKKQTRARLNEVLKILNENAVAHYISSEMEDVAFVRAMKETKRNVKEKLDQILPNYIFDNDITEVDDNDTHGASCLRIRIE